MLGTVAKYDNGCATAYYKNATVAINVKCSGVAWHWGDRHSYNSHIGDSYPSLSSPFKLFPNAGDPQIQFMESVGAIGVARKCSGCTCTPRVVEKFLVVIYKENL